MILDNLRKAGIQARDKKEHLNFEPFASEWLHTSGKFTDANGDSKRVTNCIGPELVKEAAKEALRGVGFDLLYVLGFAFDPNVDLAHSLQGERRGDKTEHQPTNAPCVLLLDATRWQRTYNAAALHQGSAHE